MICVLYKLIRLSLLIYSILAALFFVCVPIKYWEKYTQRCMKYAKGIKSAVFKSAVWVLGDFCGKSHLNTVENTGKNANRLE